MSEINYEEYIGKKVKIKYSNKRTYNKILGLYGTIERVLENNFGVIIDGIRNSYSGCGTFWFKLSEINILENESEDIKMEGFKNVAIVNLLDDYNKKDYGFALYDEDMDLLIKTWNGEEFSGLVVTNARGKDNRVLGKVKMIMSTEEYGKGVTAQVVGVVNMDAYNARVEEENRLKEIAKKKAEIEKALDAEIKKRKDAEYYEEMAKKYSDNPLIGQLVAELKGLGA